MSCPEQGSSRASVAHCRAAISVRGEHFFCDETAPHQGIHGSVAAETIWVSDTEARALPDANAEQVLCPTITPEPHGLGEFPMTCYRCHIDADS